jgi:hypothetical protein
MRRRQTVPRQWLIIADQGTIAPAFRLPRGSGILLLQPLSGRAMRRLRQSARQRSLTIVKEQ